MIITNIDINDLESIFSIQESVFKEEPLLTGLEYFKHITSRDDLKVYFEKYDFLKAVDDDGSISGLICASENNNTLYIMAVVVKKEKRNKGIGRKLVFAVEHIYSGIRLEIQTPETMPKNSAFYESMGYSIYKKENNANGEQIITFAKLIEAH